MVVFTLTDKLIGYLLGESDHRTVQSCRISGSNCTFCPSNGPKSIHSEMMGNRGTAKKLKTGDGCGVLLCDNDKNDQQTFIRNDKHIQCIPVILHYSSILGEDISSSWSQI